MCDTIKKKKNSLLFILFLNIYYFLLLILKLIFFTFIENKIETTIFIEMTSKSNFVVDTWEDSVD